MKFVHVLALTACALWPALARADMRLQDAGACQVWAPVTEDPALRWDYWWSGDCAGGLGTGEGYLLQFMRGGGFGDVYGARLVEGRMSGELRAWGPRFLGAEWTLRSGPMARDGEMPDAWQPVEAGLSRFALPVALQQALDRFAVAPGHPQMPPLPVAPGSPRCPAYVDAEGRPNGEGRGTEVAGFIRAHGGPDTARREALVQALQAQQVQQMQQSQQAQQPPDWRSIATPPAAEARRQLALATAVAGCANAAGR